MHYLTEGRAMVVLWAEDIMRRGYLERTENLSVSEQCSRFKSLVGSLV